MLAAFKEWAVICQALDSGGQCLILRKGGIAEEGGRFRVEHSEFLLYPTLFHEHRAGLKPGHQSAFDAVTPSPGVIEFTNFVRVTDVWYVTDLDRALTLDPLHVWTADVIRQRFRYRTPGLFVLAVRVFRLPAKVIRPERPEYAGCKTWVTLDVPVDSTGATPVLTDDVYADRVRVIRELLNEAEANPSS